MKSIKNIFVKHPILSIAFPVTFAVSFLLGIFYTSLADAKYMTAAIGAFAGIIAFAGIVYSKEREREIKNLEINHAKEQERLTFIRGKKEEIIFIIHKWLRLEKELLQAENPLTNSSIELANDSFQTLQQWTVLYELYQFGDSNLFKILIESSQDLLSQRQKLENFYKQLAQLKIKNKEATTDTELYYIQSKIKLLEQDLETIHESNIEIIEKFAINVILFQRSIIGDKTDKLV